jgi:hypothetical protein
VSVNKLAESALAPTAAEGSVELASREGDHGPRLQTAKFETLALDFTYASPRVEAKLALVDDKRGSFRAAATSKIPLTEARPPELSRWGNARSSAR